MPKFEQIPNFEAWKSIESIKNPSELQRKLVSEFTASALCGDFEAVFLSEVKRRVDGDPLSHEFITELVPSCRYGKITNRNLLRMKQVFANQNDITSDEEWLGARMIHEYHYHSEKVWYQTISGVYKLP